MVPRKAAHLFGRRIVRVFLVGATGFVGSAIAARLDAEEHRVVGLSRTAQAAERLRANGFTPVGGDLDERLGNALDAARAADAVVYAAQIAPEREATVVGHFLGALAGTGKTFLFLSGTGVFMQRTEGSWSEDSFAEDDSFEPEPLAAARVRTEAAVRAAATSGLRTMVVRPPYLWGAGEHGHVAAVHDSVTTTGAACYVGEGLNCYTHLHVSDGARLVTAALARGAPGALYHGAAGEVPNRWIAEAVAERRGCATRSITTEEATQVWGEFTALIMGASSRSRSPRSRRELGWWPIHTDLLGEIGST